MVRRLPVKNLLLPVLLLLLVAVPHPADAQIRPAADLLSPFETKGAGARATALGGAYTAVDATADALLFNPAGLAGVLGYEVLAHHYEGFSSMREERLVGAFEVGPGAWGIEIHSLGYGRIDARDEQGYPFDGSTTGRQGAALGWGMSLTRDYAVGASLHVARQQLMGREERIFWGDAGFQVVTGDRLTCGVAARGLGPRARDGELPLLLSAGAVYKTREKEPLLLLLSVDHQPKGASFIALGAERTISGPFTARLGCRVPLTDERLEGFRSVAAGFGYRRGALRFDYALEPMGELGFTHRVSLGASVITAPPPMAKRIPMVATPTPMVSTLPTRSAPLTTGPGIAEPSVIPTVEATFTPVPKVAASEATPANGDQLRVYDLDAEKGVDSGAKTRVKELLTRVKKPDAGPEAWWELGQFYELSGYSKYARQCYENVLKLDPMHPGALKKLGK